MTKNQNQNQPAPYANPVKVQRSRKVRNMETPPSNVLEGVKRFHVTLQAVAPRIAGSRPERVQYESTTGVAYFPTRESVLALMAAIRKGCKFLGVQIAFDGNSIERHPNPEGGDPLFSLNGYLPKPAGVKGIRNSRADAGASFA